MNAAATATIWKVTTPTLDRRKPGRVLAARLTLVQAQEMADQLKRDGVACEVTRA